MSACLSSLSQQGVLFFINQDGLDMKNNTENSWLLSNSSSSVFTEGAIWLISQMLLLLCLLNYMCGNITWFSEMPDSKTPYLL